MAAVRGSLLAAILFFAAGAVQAQEKAGTNYHDSVQISKGLGGIVLPLPSGVWRLGNIRSSRATGVDYNIPIEIGALVPLDVDKKTNQFRSLIGYWHASSNSENAGWLEPAVCSDSDQYYVFKSDQNRRRKRVRCWGIKLLSVKASPQLPELLIGVTYFWSEQTKALHVTYYFNPQTAGFPPLTQQGWGKNAITSDANKVKYLEDLKAWATEWQPKIEQGFLGKQP